MTRTRTAEQKKEHAARQKAWLYDPDHPERLEKKRQRDRDNYQKNKEKRLAYVKGWYEENKESVAERMKGYREEITEMVRVAKAQPCADCGGSFPQCVMEFHHLDPSQKSGEVSNRSTPNAAQREMDKCVVVCANCHRIRES
jgi:hypothetical protein